MADALLTSSSSSDSDNYGYKTAEEEADNTPQATVILIHPQLQLSLECEELTVFRRTLRCLSLWCPTSACLAERYLYPVLINALLTLIIASDFNSIANGAWKSIDIYVFLAIDFGMYLSHLFGVFYFRSRDLENNLLNVRLQVTQMEEFRATLKRFKIGIILSYFFLVVLVLLFFNTEVWMHGRFQCNSSFKFMKGFVNHFVCFLNYPTSIYGVGNSLALSWTMYLLHQVCSVRLQQLLLKYLRWTGSAEDAVYDHLTNYSRKVKSSCSHLTKWFVTHNIILIIATPFFCIDIIKAFQGITTSNGVQTGLFLGFLLYTAVIWVAPLYFAEQLQNHDEEFCSRVNEFCPGTFAELESELSSASVHFPNTNQDCYLFRSRNEVNKFLSYLKNRKSGFLMGSYSFQLKLSMVSVFLAMISFAIRVVG